MLRSILRILVRRRLFWLAIIFVSYFVISFCQLDPDFGWHLVSGNYFLAHGIPKSDIYTYTASSFLWIDHEWLNDIFMALIYRIGGYGLLAVIFAGLWTFGIWLAGRRVSVPALLVAVIATLPFAGVRTVTWSFVFLAVTIFLLQLPHHKKLLLAPLFLLWANLHGSFIVGFIVMAYEGLRRLSWRIGLLLLVCIAVTFINPYGWHVYQEIWRTLSDSELHTQIHEWASFAYPVACLPFVFMWIGVFVATYRKRILVYGKLDALAFFASLLTVRNTPLFVILSLEPLQQRIDAFMRTVPKTLDRPRRRFLLGAGIALAIITLFCLWFNFRNFSFNRTSNYPVQGVAELREHACKGNLFNDYAYGGYLIWQLPSEKVFIDGRMPSWRHGSTKYLDDYQKILNNTTFRREQFQKYHITCALVSWSRHSFTNGLLKDGWTATTNPEGSTLLRAPSGA